MWDLKLKHPDVSINVTCKYVFEEIRAFIGPSPNCYIPAEVVNAFNIPMFSYVSIFYVINPLTPHIFGFINLLTTHKL